MVKQVFTAITLIFVLASCSSLKQLNLGSKKPATPESQAKTPSNPSQPKFIDQISMQPQSVGAVQESRTEPNSYITRDELAKKENIDAETASVENVSDLQLKYSVLLNTDVEEVQNLSLLKGVDEWYGTRYRMGGTTKKGVDCSAFVCAIFASVYSVTLPRVARDQYKFTRRISRTELQEGDLLFFNTRGGVSHVGIYLQNNKFVHASTSKGVTVSDMFEEYYLKRFIGAGRVQNKVSTVASN